MDRLRHVVLALLIAGPLLLTGRQVGAQNPTGFGEQVAVELVEIEVVVRDADGRPVTDLTRDDFELRQGRKKVDIELFASVVDGVPVAETGAPGPTRAEDPLHLLIYVDRSHMDHGLEASVVDGLGELILIDLEVDDRILVAEGRFDGVEVLQPFTTDTDAVLSALRQIGPRQSQSRVQSEMRRLLQTIENTKKRKNNDGLSLDENPQMVQADIAGFANEVQRELDDMAQRIDGLVRAAAGIPGRKEVLILVGTPPTNAVRVVMDRWNRAFGSQSTHDREDRFDGLGDVVQPLRNAAAENVAQHADSSALFARLAARANALDVKLHVFDVGLREDQSLGMDDAEMLPGLAEATGGRALREGGDVKTSLGQVAGDLRNHYVLAFTPDKGDGAEGLQEISVELGRKARKQRGSLTVHHRHAFVPGDPDRSAAEQAVSVLLLGAEHNPLGFRLETSGAAEPVAGRDDVLRLPLVVIFPIARVEMVSGDGGVLQGHLSLFVTSGDLERGAAPVQKVDVPLSLTTEQLTEAGDSNIEYKIDVPLMNGGRRVAVALRDDLKGEVSATVLEVGG